MADKIVEALKKLLPEDQINEVASAVNDMLESSKRELESSNHGCPSSSGWVGCGGSPVGPPA